MVDKCETCWNVRPVISENGLHYVCGLSDGKARNCFLGKKDHYDRKMDGELNVAGFKTDNEHAVGAIVNDGVTFGFHDKGEDVAELDFD